MNLYASTKGQVIEVHQIGNLDLLSSLFEKHGDSIAGVITEFPTNPLLQAGDLEKARGLCDQADALLVVDPTMVSPKNARITGMADVVVNSLTKYAGWEGDVMMGSLAFPRTSKLGRELFEVTQSIICPPYSRDLTRMAEQIPYYDNFIERVNAQTLEVAEFLQNHPKVKHLHWAYQNKYAKNFEKFAGANRPGCNLSFEVSGNFEEFYNRLQMLKSPSFGTEFSNCCPYVYLAHYPLIKTDKGREFLDQAGLSPYLLRLSVGLEPVEEIVQCIDRALQ
jgi:cystathionine gamma-synthase